MTNEEMALSSTQATCALSLFSTIWINIAISELQAWMLCFTTGIDLNIEKFDRPKSSSIILNHSLRFYLDNLIGGYRK